MNLIIINKNIEKYFNISDHVDKYIFNNTHLPRDIFKVMTKYKLILFITKVNWRVIIQLIYNNGNIHRIRKSAVKVNRRLIFFRKKRFVNIIINKIFNFNETNEINEINEILNKFGVIMSNNFSIVERNVANKTLNDDFSMVKRNVINKTLNYSKNTSVNLNASVYFIYKKNTGTVVIISQNGSSFNIIKNGVYINQNIIYCEKVMLNSDLTIDGNSLTFDPDGDCTISLKGC